MTTPAQWIHEQIDALESEQARVTEMVEREPEYWATKALTERLGQIRSHLNELRKRT